jgi:hypothetical protein
MASSYPPAEADLSRARQEDARQYRAWLDGEDAAAGFLTCERCAGAGTIPPDGELIRVEGDRLLVNRASWSPCPNCGGTGRTHHPGVE